MLKEWLTSNGFKLLLNRAVIALLGAVSGVLFATFPLEMAQLCGGG